MQQPRLAGLLATGTVLALLAACSQSPMTEQERRAFEIDQELTRTEGYSGRNQSHGKTDEFARTQGIWSLFNRDTESNVGTNVNRYLWQAALETLDFMPVETVDPFTGVIATGYGTPPGGGQAYRATVYVTDPSLDARSLKLALQTRGGQAVSAETTRKIEDAILTRARQLRVRDSKM